MADNVTISIGADSTKLRADLALAQASLKQFGAELRNAAATAKQTGDTAQLNSVAASYNQVADRVRTLSAELRNTHQATNGLHGAFGAGLGVLRASGEHLGEIRSRLGEAATAFSDMADKVFPHFKEVLALTIAAAIAEITKLVNETSNAFRQLENQASTIGVTTDAMEALRLVFAKAGIGGNEMADAFVRSARQIGEVRQQAIEASGNLNFFAGGATVLRGKVDELGKASEGAAAKGNILTDAQRGVNEVFKSGAQVFRGGTQATIEFDKIFNDLILDVARFPNNAQGMLDLQVAISERILSLSDATLRASVGTKQYGKNWADVAAGFVDLGKNLKTAMHELEQGGMTLSNFDKEGFRAFNRAKAVAGEYFDRVKQVFGAELARALTPGIQALTDFVKNNNDLIRGFARSVGEAIGTLVRDIIFAFQGLDNAVQNKWIIDLKNALLSIPMLIEGVKIAFGLLSSALEPVAQLINSTFGTNLSGRFLAIAGAIAAMTGGFTVLSTALLALVPLVTLAAAGGPWVLLAIAVAGVGLAVYLLRDKIYEVFVTNAPPWLQDLVALLGKIVAFMANEFTQGVHDLGSNTVREFQTISNAIQASYEWLQRFIAKAAEAAKAGAAALTPQFPGDAPLGNAGGGLIIGRGGIDTNLRRLTSGEFVMRVAAVRQWGLDFMQRLNAGMMPQGLAGGGLVTTGPALRFPGASSVGSGSGRAPVHIHIGGREFVTRADDDTATALLRVARSEQLSSAGRPPAWKG